MNKFHVLSLLCLVAMTFGYHVGEMKKRSDGEYFINYVTSSLKNGQMRGVQKKQGQAVTIHNKEVQFVVQGGMSVVLDFDKMLMTMKNSPDAKYCGVLAFNEELVTLQQIKNALKNPDKEFKFPNKKTSLHLQKDDIVYQSELSPLSAELCKGLEVYELKPMPEVQNTVKALSVHRRLRPKRDVGWGEVLLIVVVIIILL
ncbi:uncharacterized protein LOC132734975 [Ruditapes philippinarum]|uniref:uncharacterized protein LOC132734975 n=1 Tax=Ruditapes philippinarum TaxID=129788 RepID=UPI00295AF086|nr:uncharacterized protein LOC132734975 [Ruditapes philippinarum]